MCDTCTVESRDYAPPLLNWANGRGLIRRILTFPCDDHYRPSNATWARGLCTFSGCLIGKTREKRSSKAIARLLVVATVFSWLIVYNVCILQSERRGLLHETKLPMQELKLKMQGAYARGGT